MASKFVAHKLIDEHGDTIWQSIQDHLIEVRDLAAEFGADLNIPHVTGLAGWLHDAGKYSNQFQDYIVNDNGKRGSVNHAFAGADILRGYLKDSDFLDEMLFEFVGNTVMAHHGPAGPYDFCAPAGSSDPKFTARFAKKGVAPEEVAKRFFAEFDEQDFRTYVRSARDELSMLNPNGLFKNQNLYQRFISSCLVDADHLKTADFMSASSSTDLPDSVSMSTLFKRNEQAVSAQKKRNANVADPALMGLNQMRDEMSEASYSKADSFHRLFSLSVPTGGGKTLASLRFGLRRCVQKSLQRIIFIVPFTAVIEQNAASVRSRLGLDADDYADVLEYHSAVTAEQKSDADIPKDERYIYARDTWDAPIIFTTQVAYLNALFGSGSKNLRHMHRLVRSVLIFDEVQSMPFKCVAMANDALNWLTTATTSTGLLCTATQPTLDVKTLTAPLNPADQIVKDVPAVEEAFKRVQIVPHFQHVWQLEELENCCVSEFETVNSVLVILNTKSAVWHAYMGFNQDGIRKFHLSTAMCQAHRKQKFAQIKAAVAEARNGGEKVIVFSTKLIEAGVDLSFETVYRSAAGLDSIVQAAGRCNRNHELPMAYVHTFTMDGTVENLGWLPDISDGASITRELVKAYPHTDLLSNFMVGKYFSRLFGMMNSKLNYPIKLWDATSLLELVTADKSGVPNFEGHERANRNPPMQLLSAAPRTVAQNFEPIDSKTISVVVQWKEDIRSQQLVAEIESRTGDVNDISELLQRAQAFSVQIYGDSSSVKKRLGDAIVDYSDDLGLFIARETAYSDEFGLNLFGEEETSMSELFF